MTVTHTGSRVRNVFRTGHQIVFADNLVRVIDVQLKTGHNGQMIPKFMLEIGHVTQMREHIAHDIYNRVGTTLTFRTVLYSQRIVNHILYAAPVFGKRHSFLLGIILHNLKKLKVENHFRPLLIVYC